MEGYWLEWSEEQRESAARCVRATEALPIHVAQDIIVQLESMVRGNKTDKSLKLREYVRILKGEEE